MDIHLHNTLSNKKEVFVPIVPHTVSMYNCGPTVYHFAHIGNLRSYVFANVLRRMFEWNGYTVNQVINITDVGHLTSDADSGEDKIENAVKREHKTVAEITDLYTHAFFDDLTKLNIDTKHITFPKATAYIQQQIAMIEMLEKKGLTYKTSDGIYFDTKQFPEYGKLGNIPLAELEEGARIGIHAEKRNPTDFALWKLSPENEKREQEWPSPWGVGFPGWHIECSAMSKALLGETLDIHTGGIDHIPVHHNNEIAQSVCANDKPFVHYWMHNAFLTVDDGKMAKSGNNFITLKTLEEKNITPLAYRYLLLTARYSSPLQFNFDALVGSQNALERLQSKLAEIQEDDHITGETICQELKNKFTTFINDDLDTPKALALVWDVLKNPELTESDKKKLILDFDRVFGLDLGRVTRVDIPEHIQKLVAERDLARAEKNWQKSDALREQIEAEGFVVKDTESGTKIGK